MNWVRSFRLAVLAAAVWYGMSPAVKRTEKPLRYRAENRPATPSRTTPVWQCRVRGRTGGELRSRRPASCCAERNRNSDRREARAEQTSRAILRSEIKAISQMAVDGLRDSSPITGTDQFQSFLICVHLLHDCGSNQIQTVALESREVRHVSSGEWDAAAHNHRSNLAVCQTS